LLRTINILPENLANKIAAGEVVQRPASAIKELVENSIDAGATTITVIVKEAGKKLLQVVDDGYGMSEEDAAVAFERHSTSKIASFEDLEKIRTLGFRGEALASIAAVSQVELLTRQSAVAVGTRVRIEGGLRIEITEEAAHPGTSVTVKNLFYNTPARQKFLKATNTEFKHIFDVIQRIALSHPRIETRFISDGETVLHLHPSTMEERVRDVFGEQLFKTVFSFEENAGMGTVGGFLGKPDFARKSRAEQYLFLNSRYIINRSLNHAVYQAYENLLEKTSFPFFILFLTLDTAKVDVNVHPSKMEVKFEDESSIYRMVLSAVRRALAAHDLIPTVGMRGEASAGKNVGLRFAASANAPQRRPSFWQELLKVDAKTGEVIPESPTPATQAMLQSDKLPVDGRDKASTHRSLIPDSSYRISEVPVWQIHDKYIIVPIENGLLIVDQHAAHERVIYERAVERFNRSDKKIQQLLFPHTIEMTPGDAALVRQLNPLLETLGFAVKLFGKTTVILDGVPGDIKPGCEGQILQDVLDLYKEDEQGVKVEPRERLAKSYSCKAAIKAGDRLNEPEIRSLLDQLFAAQLPYTCPHGRPVMVKLSLSELDKRFGRTS